MNTTKSERTIDSLGLLVGVVIGAGMFALPYVVSQVGILWGIFYLIFGGIVFAILHTLYGEVIYIVQGKHRFPGYVRVILGARAGQLATFALIFGFFGSLLAYGILGGIFIEQLFNFGSSGMFSLFFFVFAPLLLQFDFKRIGRINFMLTAPLLLFVVVLGILAFSQIEVSNFQHVNNAKWFLPYGVFIFSFGGIAAIPEVAETLKKKEGRLFEKIIFLGALVPAIIYGVFIISVVGVSGIATTEDAMIGLAPFLGSGIIKLGALIGFLAVFTSYLALGLDLRNTFHTDYHFGKFRSWLFIFVVPLLLFMLGADDFIDVIGFVGSVMWGIGGILILFMALYVRKRHKHPRGFIPIGKIVPAMLVVLFLLGIVWQLFTALAA